ncbi:MAG: hypothetical protein ACM3UO_00075 [Bacillota bacterium]
MKKVLIIAALLFGLSACSAGSGTDDSTDPGGFGMTYTGKPGINLGGGLVMGYDGKVGLGW